jgi:hypothetical protein
LEKCQNEPVGIGGRPLTSIWIIIQDGEKYGAPEGTMRQVKKPKSFSSYMALTCDLLEKDPTCFEESIQKKEWEDAMTRRIPIHYKE